MLLCVRLRNFVRIGPPIAETWHIDFQDGGRQPYCRPICFGVTVDHQRSDFHGLNLVLKSFVCRINTSGDIAMNIFRRLASNCLFHVYLFIYLSEKSNQKYSRPFLGVLGAYLLFTPNDVIHRPDPPKGPFFGGYTSFKPFSVRISATVRPGRVNEKKYRITQ